MKLCFCVRSWPCVHRVPESRDADAAAADVGRALLLHDRARRTRLAGSNLIHSLLLHTSRLASITRSCCVRCSVRRCGGVHDCDAGHVVQFVGVEAFTTVMLDMLFSS